MTNYPTMTPKKNKIGLALSIKTTAMLLLSSCSILIGTASAQDINDIRWKSESQVREILGEPQSTTPPVGTHATYTMWKYEDFTVAFANQRAFHMFKHDSLRKMELNQQNEQDNQ